MTISIDTNWFRSLAAAIAGTLGLTGAPSCGVRPCTCDCICNSGHSYCKSTDPANAAGTVNCHNICFGIGIPEHGLVCKDKTQDTPLPPVDPPTPPPCSESTPDQWVHAIY